MMRSRGRTRIDFRRTWSVWLLALALVLQGAIPVAAMAADLHGRTEIELCTLHGLERVALDSGADKHRHFGGLACEQCVMASFAGLAAAPPAFAPPSCAAFLIEHPARAESLVTRALVRRPPARGPPVVF